MGAFTFVAIVGMYYILPKALGRPLGGALASFHFWVSLVGVVLLYVALTFAGLAQGTGWAAGAPFDQVLFGIRPCLVTQAWAMVLLLGTHAAFAYNVFKTMGAARAGRNGSPRRGPHARTDRLRAIVNGRDLRR